MNDDRPPKCSQKENRAARPSFRRPINRSAAFRDRKPTEINKEIHERLPKRKVVATLTRTNAPMNNRVILFREPIRLSIVQKIRVGATEAGEREKKRETEGEKRIERREKNEETRRAASRSCFSRNSRAVTALGFSLLQDLRQDGDNPEAVSRSVDAGICDQLMPTSL